MKNAIQLLAGRTSFEEEETMGAVVRAMAMVALAVTFEFVWRDIRRSGREQWRGMARKQNSNPQKGVER